MNILTCKAPQNSSGISPKQSDDLRDVINREKNNKREDNFKPRAFGGNGASEGDSNQRHNNKHKKYQVSSPESGELSASASPASSSRNNRAQ